MKDFCVVSYEPCSGRFFKKGRLREDNIYIYELDITVTRFTLMCGKRIPPRLMKMLNAKTSEYKNVFSLCVELTGLKRYAGDISIMTLMPLASLKKCAGMSGVDLESEQVAIIVKNLPGERVKAMLQLCSGLSFAKLYGEGAENLSEIIMEETGLCVSSGSGEPTESFRITADKNITFEYVPHGRVYKELALHTPLFLDKYKKVIPCEEVFEAFLKTEKGNEYIKSKKVKIIGVM